MGPFDATFFIGVAVAAGVSLAAHAGLGAASRRWDWTASWSGAATLLAAVAGLMAMFPPTSLPPINGVDWPQWGLLAGAAMLAIAPTRTMRRALVTALVTGGCAALILHRSTDFTGLVPQYATGIGVAAGACALLWEFVLGECGDLAARGTMLVVAAAAFAAFMLAGSFQTAFRGAPLAAAIAAPLAIAWWRAPAGGLAGAVAIGFAAVATAVYAFNDWKTPPKSEALAPAFALIALAPAAAWLARLPAVAARPRLAQAVAIVATAAVAGAGVGWLALHQPVKAAGGDDYGWG